MVKERRSFWRDLWSGLLADLPRTAVLLVAVGIGLVITLGLLQLVRLLGVANRFGDAFVFATVFIGAIVAWLVLNYSAFLLGRRSSRHDSPTIGARLEVLNRSINETVDLAAEIETELRTRQRAFEELRARSAQLEELARLNEQTAEAVTELIRGVVQRQGRRDVVVNSAIGFLIGVVTTVLGLIVSGALSHH